MTVEQLGLVFDPKPRPRARRKDPATSHAAAARAESFAARHQDRILAALEQPGTIYDLAARTKLSHVAIARRMPELHAAGLAEPTQEKRDGCRVWRRT